MSSRLDVLLVRFWNPISVPDDHHGGDEAPKFSQKQGENDIACQRADYPLDLYERVKNANEHDWPSADLCLQRNGQPHHQSSQKEVKGDQRAKGFSDFRNDRCHRLGYYQYGNKIQDLKNPKYYEFSLPNHSVHYAPNRLRKMKNTAPIMRSAAHK
jgi:hypothetical protein